MSRRLLSGGLTAAALALFACGTAVAGPGVKGDEVARRVDRVMEAIAWSDSLDDLKERAAGRRKLVFWLQIVGELDGGL